MKHQKGVSVLKDANRGGCQHIEDVLHTTHQDISSQKTTIFAVYDGHGGKNASLFARCNLCRALEADKQFQSEGAEVVKNAIQNAFHKTQNDMSGEVGEKIIFTLW